jgi:hypothetical protein
MNAINRGEHYSIGYWYRMHIENKSKEEIRELLVVPTHIII